MTETTRIKRKISQLVESALVVIFITTLLVYFTSSATFTRDPTAIQYIPNAIQQDLHNASHSSFHSQGISQVGLSKDDQLSPLRNLTSRKLRRPRDNRNLQNAFKNTFKQQQTTSFWNGGNVYYTIIAGTDQSMLGASNPDVAINNPLKGFVGMPRNNAVGNAIISTLDLYFIGLDEVMFADPKIVGIDKAFDWTVTDAILFDSASRNKHVIWRFLLQETEKGLRVPSFLLENGIGVYEQNVTTNDGNINSMLLLKYDDPILLDALEQFIMNLGKRYNGDTRLAFLQMGLIGLSGEGGKYSNIVLKEIIPDGIPEKIQTWYQSAFPTTKLQAWYPVKGINNTTNSTNGIGYIDDSFAYSTLDGIYNGNINASDFFWPTIIRNGQEEFWKTGVMGGTTYSELQNTIFNNDYPSFTEYHQDFLLCVETTHTTYISHQQAFLADTSLTGDALQNFLVAHARMGYNFYISQVDVLLSTTTANKDRDSVNVEVTIKQSGVAPFYYPLNIQLTCPTLIKPVVVKGVEQLIGPSDEQLFQFTNIPSSASCLNKMQLTLESPYVYPQHRIKFAQDFINTRTGGVDLNIPTPSDDYWNTATKGLITGLTLIDTGIKGSSFLSGTVPIQQLKDGDTIDLAVVGVNLSVQCDVDTAQANSIQQVTFSWDGQRSIDSDGRPWTLQGANDGNYLPVAYLSFAGNKTITAIAYGPSGELLGKETIVFNIVDSSSALPRSTQPTVPPQKGNTNRPRGPKPTVPTPTNPPSTRNPPSRPEPVLKSCSLMNTGFMFDFPIHEIKNGDIISIDPKDTDFSIQCEMRRDVNKVMFHWNGKSHLALTPPWALDGRTGKLYNTVPYLGTMGKKIIMIAAFTNETIVGTSNLEFILIPIVKPPPGFNPFDSNTTGSPSSIQSHSVLEFYEHFDSITATAMSVPKVHSDNYTSHDDI